MSSRVEDLFAEASSLETKDRARLADLLLESLNDSPLSPAWEAEIQRRLDRFDRGETKAIPGDQVIQELKAKYGG